MEMSRLTRDGTAEPVSRDQTLRRERHDVCMYVMYCHHFQQIMNQPCMVFRQSCSRSAEWGELIFPCPRSRLIIWSRETGSAVPSRASVFILHTKAESGAYSRDSSRFPRRHPFMYTANRHRVSPEFIRSHNRVPMAFTAESP